MSQTVGDFSWTACTPGACAGFSQRIPNVAYHEVGELFGFKGLYVDSPDRLGAAWDEALNLNRPVVLKVKIDPEVPPLPPHIILKQAKNFMSALIKGDPHESGIIAGAARQVLGSILAGDR